MQASEISRSLQLDDVIRSDCSTCLAAFADTLDRSPETTIEVFLKARPPADRSQLAGLIAIELRHLWERGEPREIERYFEQFPELREDREQVLDLIYAEYCERRQHQPEVNSAEYFERFPDFRDSLERLFRIDSLFGGDPDALDHAGDRVFKLPDAGDDFLDFKLLDELGRGAFGRVFLAEQTDLSGRRVVVKITPLRTIEHKTLARLEHPNIVPVHSVHHDELSGLHAVCMPYQSAVALTDVQATWRNAGQLPTQADAFLIAVNQLVSSELQKTAEPLEDSPFPVRADYVYACCWIMHRLATALHHAHLRGVYHRDLKPSNILLSTTGQPLLVDFNLAFDKEETGGDSKAFFGGTLPYMPPEQIEVLHPAEQGRADDVGPRSDIYSLAATMFELLTARLPFAAPEPGGELLMVLRSQLVLRHGAIPSARALNPLVPNDLDGLLTKCLDPAPFRRYETAAQLAEDLARFLQVRPLRHIGKIPVAQILLKFVRRNRRTVMAGAAITATALVVAGAVQLIHLRTERERIAKVNAERGRDEAKAHEDEAWTNAELEVEREMRVLMKELPEKEWGRECSRKGRENYLRRRFPVAILWCNKAESLGHDWYMLNYYRGRCLTYFDKDREALEDFSKAIAFKRDFAYGYLNRAIVYSTSKECMNLPNAIEDMEKAIKFHRPDIDEGVTVFLHDAARVYAAIFKNYPVDIDLPLSKEESLRKAEEHLFKAVKLGFPPKSVWELNSADRFKMLEPVLERDHVKKFLEDHDNGQSQPTP